MGKIYKIESQTNCAALNLAAAAKSSEKGVLVIPEKEAKLAVAGGRLEVENDIQK